MHGCSNQTSPFIFVLKINMIFGLITGYVCDFTSDPIKLVQMVTFLQPYP